MTDIRKSDSQLDAEAGGGLSAVSAALTGSERFAILAAAFGAALTAFESGVWLTVWWQGRFR